jgi:hypothetical protein
MTQVAQPAALSGDSRLAIVRVVLEIADLGAKYLNAAPVTKLVEFLKANESVLADLIDWLFSDSGQSPALAADSAIMMKAKAAGVDQAQLSDFLGRLQAAVAHARREELVTSDVAEFTRAVHTMRDEGALGEQLTLSITRPDHMQSLSGASPEVDRALQRQSFSFADFLKYLPVVVEIVRQLFPKK